jgi:Ca-activated chloride channel family protein
MVLGYVLFSLWKKRVLKSLASAKMIDHIAPERSSFKGWLKQILFWLGWAFICLGLVNPQIGTELETVKREGVDLVFAIDVSKSMLAEDIAPNRLEKAKRLAGELINQLVSDRVGIFAHYNRLYRSSIVFVVIGHQHDFIPRDGHFRSHALGGNLFRRRKSNQPCGVYYF